MIELLALPDWNTPPRTIADWTDQLATLGHPARSVHEEGETWIEVPSLRCRGLAVAEEGHLTAIHFELNDPDPEPATCLLEAAAQVLGWEIHEDEEDDSEVEED
ncbi:MAG: hypothetical protein IRY99_03025 [Isosphaeraceae bacterium]|nr:hypothetical protein [Isosphaeraceae bacterium]